MVFNCISISIYKYLYIFSETLDLYHQTVFGDCAWKFGILEFGNEV